MRRERGVCVGGVTGWLIATRGALCLVPPSLLLSSPLLSSPLLSSPPPSYLWRNDGYWRVNSLWPLEEVADGEMLREIWRERERQRGGGRERERERERVREDGWMMRKCFSLTHTHSLSHPGVPGEMMDGESQREKPRSPSSPERGDGCGQAPGSQAPCSGARPRNPAGL